MRRFNCDVYGILLNMYSENSGFGLVAFCTRGVYLGEGVITPVYTSFKIGAHSSEPFKEAKGPH